jgi:hypothetical protein
MTEFNVHPDRLSSISCELSGEKDAGNYSTNYLVDVNTIDMNEAERLSIIYSEDGRFGIARRGRLPLVPIAFTIWVWGTTQAGAMDNARALQRAMSNPHGGYIEYRPLGLSSSVLTTWYRYLPSKPPALVDGGVALSQYFMEKFNKRDGQVYAVRLDFSDVMTYAWATSDPDSPATLLSTTTVDNCDDADQDNYVVVNNSNIKGDGAWPNVVVEYSNSAIKTLLLYHRSMPDGSSSNLDYLESGDYNSRTNFSTQADAGKSGGSYERCSSATGNIHWLVGSGWDLSYLGKVTPLIAVLAGSGDTWDLTFNCEGSGVLRSSSARELVGTGDWQIFELPEIDFPPFNRQLFIDDGSTPTIGTYLAVLQFVLYVERTSGSGSIDIDFAVVARAEEFICKFTNSDADMLGNPTPYVEIDAFSDGVYMKDGSDRVLDVPDRYGVPIKEFFLRSEYDHRIRFFVMDDVDDDYDAVDQIDVTVTGIFGTIFPFSET